MRETLNQPVVVYKLTSADMTTHNDYPWELGIKNEATGEGPLCSAGWLHAYEHPEIATLLNPIHANLWPYRLFKAIAEGVMLKEPLKLGVTQLMLTEELKIPQWTHLDYVAWAIFVTRVVLKRGSIPKWDRWADEVIDTHTIGDAASAAEATMAADRADRAAMAARAARAAVAAAVEAAAVEAAAVEAAEAADRAAAEAAGAARAAVAAARAAARAAGAAEAAIAARAAEAAAEAAGTNFNILEPHSTFMAWREQPIQR